ncbi:Uncharacterised protein [Mycobacterium tuberculosis]|nr:Uncharacterised protein [Mycobacterium tuberculosis]
MPAARTSDGAPGTGRGFAHAGGGGGVAGAGAVALGDVSGAGGWAALAISSAARRMAAGFCWGMSGRVAGAASQNSAGEPGRRTPEARARLPVPAGASRRGVAGGRSASAGMGRTSSSWEMSRVVRRQGFGGAVWAAAWPAGGGGAAAAAGRGGRAGRGVGAGSLRRLRWALTAARSIAAGASPRRQTRATITTSRGSRIGVRRHQVRGSAR